jgi:hypothetical protein
MTSYRVSYRHGEGVVEDAPGGTLRTTPITSLIPWRAVNNHQGQNHQTSLQYHPRSGRHIPCESRLEQFLPGSTGRNLSATFRTCWHSASDFGRC